MKKLVFLVVLLTGTLVAVHAGSIPPLVKPDARGNLLLWPASARLVTRDGEKAPVLNNVPDDFGLDGWQAVEVPANPGAALAWTLDAGRGGDYQVYVEFQVSGQSPLGFRLAVADAAITGQVYRTDSGGLLAPHFGGTVRFVVQHIGRIHLAAGAQRLTLGDFARPAGLSAEIGAIYLCPAPVRPLSCWEIQRRLDRARPWIAPVKLGLPRLISDHLVLQRDAKVPLWGRAKPGARVEVEFLGQKKRATADARGFWRVALDPLKAGGPYELVIRSGSETRTLTDVLVGEVWLGAGQSNMTWALAVNPELGPNYMCDKATIDFVGKANYPRIHISSAAHHLVTPNGGTWLPLPAAPTRYLPSLMTCTAILLQEQLQVPVGIIIRAFGGTTGAAWLDRDGFENDPTIQKCLLQPAGSAWADGSGLYQGYIVPVLLDAVRGVVWDQGESGTGLPGLSQQDLLAALIAGWRQAAGKPELPFIYMRKDQYGTGPEFTNTMSRVARSWMVDNTGLSKALHPPDKLEYAKRLVRVMMTRVYAVPQQ